MAPALRSLFSTPVYQAQCDDADLIARLAHMARTLAQDDRAGRAWSRAHGYRGYTSYASLNDLPMRDPDAAALKRIVDRHVAAFAGIDVEFIQGPGIEQGLGAVRVVDGAGVVAEAFALQVGLAGLDP